MEDLNSTSHDVFNPDDFLIPNGAMADLDVHVDAGVDGVAPLVA
jgi:hypothetical protein